MLRNKTSFKRGQSMLEYGMIISLIIAGIIVGGPILLNAINAHFKLLDNATQDSLTERISSRSGTAEDCSWTDWTPTGKCGVAAGCDSINELYERTCLPDGETETECRSSSSCCTPPIENACGSLLESECIARMPLKIGSSSSAYQGTCEIKVNKQKVDSFNCLIGEKIVSVTCGVLRTNPDDKDDTYVESQTFFACTQNPYDVCLPKCSPDSIEENPLSSPCHINSSNRDFLEEEVINRKTTFASQKPYRDISRFSPIEAKEDDSILNGTVKIPFTFVQTKDDCNLDRYCEAFCEQIDGTLYLPTSAGTSCAQAACFKTRRSSFDLTNHSFNTGVLPYQAKFTVDLLPYQQATISYLEPDGTEVIYTPDLSLYAEQFEAVSHSFSIEITPLVAGEIAPGFSNLIFENECFAYKPSRFLSTNEPLTYACETNRKIIADPIAYQRYCTAFNDNPYKGFEPYQTDTHSIGCYKPDCIGNSCYFVFCE